MANPDIVFVDAGAFYAAKDSDDANHAAALNFLGSFRGNLITTNYVIDEAITLARFRAGHRTAVELGQQLWNEELARIVRVSESDERAAWELFKRYDDKDFSFTDCTSFVVMHRLGITYAFTFDDHFEQIGEFVRVPA